MDRLAQHLDALIAVQLRYETPPPSEDMTTQHSHAFQQMYQLSPGSWTLYRGCLVQRTQEGFRCEDPSAMYPIAMSDARRGTVEISIGGRLSSRTFSLPALVVAYIDVRLEEAAAA